MKRIEKWTEIREEWLELGADNQSYYHKMGERCERLAKKYNKVGKEIEALINLEKRFKNLIKDLPRI